MKTFRIGSCYSNAKFLIMYPLLFAAILAFAGCTYSQPIQSESSMETTNESLNKNPYYSRTDTTKLKLSDEEWKKVLPEDVYYISRQKGTERAFTGKYWDFEGTGTYYCAACGNPLFRSDSKFASMCGWPSFYEALRPNSVLYHQDNSYGMSRIEVVCGRCDGHLGHIFDDGPPPTGNRFCMNSVVLDFEPDQKK